MTLHNVLASGAVVQMDDSAYASWAAALDRPVSLIDGVAQRMPDELYAQHQADLAAAVRPGPVPVSITSRQLFIILARDGLISDAEAIAASQTGAMPAAIEPVIAALPANEQRDARITFARMRDVERASPLVTIVAGVFGKTSAQVDDMFRRAAAIP